MKHLTKNSCILSYLKWLVPAILILIQGCATIPKTTIAPEVPQIVLDEQQLAIAKQLKITENELKIMESKPIYKFTPQQLDKYLGYLQLRVPDLRERIKFIARKNLGEPYKLFLLGEFPFEVYDPDPMYSLEKGDCLVFSEHTYSMALGWDWQSFFAMLQRIRFINGEVGVVTRNHYTELDWDINNSWLVEDITSELAGDKAVEAYTPYDKNKFFKDRYNMKTDLPNESLTWYFIPCEAVPSIVDKLNSGDFVNIVRGYTERGAWIGHVGMVMKDPDGKVYFLHSIPPGVRQDLIIDMCNEAPALNAQRRKENADLPRLNAEIKKQNKLIREKNGGKPSKDEKELLTTSPYFYGFKFLRLRENPWEELRKIDGDKTPLVIGSQGLYIKKLKKEGKLTPPTTSNEQ